MTGLEKYKQIQVRTFCSPCLQQPVFVFVQCERGMIAPIFYRPPPRPTAPQTHPVLVFCQGSTTFPQTPLLPGHGRFVILRRVWQCFCDVLYRVRYPNASQAMVHWQRQLH